MSGLYVPGAFKKKKEEEKLVDDGKIPAPQKVATNTWGSKQTFSSLVKGDKVEVAEEKEKEEKDVVVVPYVIRTQPLEEVRFRRFFRENREQLKDLYLDMIDYDGTFLDKLKKEKNGLVFFSRFVWSLI